MITSSEKRYKERKKMTDGFGFDIERDADGKLIIRNDTPEKDDTFYRQKGGSLYFRLDSAGQLDRGVMLCLEAAKQENCTVNYETNNAGIVPLTPEMSQTDALNTFTSHWFAKTPPVDKTRQYIEKIKTMQNAPESISFEDFYFADNFKESRQKIINFCRANDIAPIALKIHYDLAIEYAKSKGGSYEVQVARGTEHFGLPEVITKENLPELKEKLVLSRDDPRVSEVQNKTSSRNYQRE